MSSVSPPAIALEDRVEIQDLSYEYAFHCDTGDFAHCPELFTDDGVFDESVIGIPRAEGKAAIRATFGSVAPGAVLWFQHFMTSIWLRPQPDGTVRGICYLRAEGEHSDGARPQVQGYYDDVYRKEDGRWLIASRMLVAMAPPSGWTLHIGSQA